MKTSESRKEIKGLSLTDLRSRARELAEELMKLRFRKATNQLERSHQIKIVKRNLARVQTFMSQKGAEGSKLAGSLES